MRIAILGTGGVGTTLATGFVRVGHEVRIGSRSATNEKAAAWVAEAGGAGASAGTFADAAAFGEVVVNATGGLVSVEALTAAGADNLAGKPLLDVANPLDYSGGFPPRVVQPDGRSLAELIQDTFPSALVV
jgi:predicted dinucleotide-binding enzyme